MEITYNQSSSNLLEGLTAYHDHREGITSCPFCDYDNREDWYKSPNLIEIVMDHNWGKTDSVIIISSCPSCKEISWVHELLRSFYTFERIIEHFPVDMERIKKEDERRQQKITDFFNKIPCKECGNVEQFVKGKYQLSIHCKTKNSSRHHFGQLECDKFIKGKVIIVDRWN